MANNNRQPRTAEDRERARAERERRRGLLAGKAGAAAAEPVGVVKPTDVTQPATVERLVEDQQRGPVEQPIEGQRRVAVDRPGAGEQPVRVEEPVEDDRRAPVEQPVEGQRRVAVDRPGAGEQPVRVEEPVEGRVAVDRPGAGEQPVAAEEPVEIEQPIEAAQPVTAERPVQLEQPAAAERPAEPRHPITVKLPRPAPLPPRIAPPRPLHQQRRRPLARARVGALLALAVAILGGILAIVLGHGKAQPKAPPPITVVKVTIPEGETRAQIARIASAKGLKGSYLKATRHSPLLNPVRYGASRGTRDLEGFLFPATYELYAGAPASRLAAEQLAAFRESFAAEQALRAHALHVTPYQLLIVASMVEREALLEHDRPRVAAVIYNRLRLGMPLGIDSTIRYALHDYSKPLTEAQLQIDSPYNTRTHHGLPPTPISNPGLASIAAAAHPAHVSYLYYVNGADGCGELVFSTSEAQFEHNAAAYREALAKHGGRVPSCRKR